MIYKQLGKTDLNVSRLCLGTNLFGAGYVSEDDIKVLIGKAIDLGINFIDTADVYNGGLSEQILGKAVSKNRQDFVIATKGGNPVGDRAEEFGLSKKYLTKALDASLRRLGMDYVDLYQVHLWDHDTPIEETVDVLDSFVRQGKVRYLGCSNFSASQLREALEVSTRRTWDRFESVQPIYNLIDRGIEAELLPLCVDVDVAVLPYQILMGGILTGAYKQSSPPSLNSHMASKHARGAKEKYWTDQGFSIAAKLGELSKESGYTTSQLMIAWTLNKKGITSVIVGSSKLQQLQENTLALSSDIPVDVLVALGNMN